MDTDIPSCFRSALEAADRAPDLEDPEQWPRLFSSIPLDVFGLLLLGVPATLPRLRSHLPMMPSDDVQRQWTGNAGRTLLMQSVAFVRSMLDQFAHVRSPAVWRTPGCSTMDAAGAD
jgi:hypothetical protein